MSHHSTFSMEIPLSAWEKLPVKPRSMLRFSSLCNLKSDFDLKGEVLKISSSFLYPSVFAIPANQRKILPSLSLLLKPSTKSLQEAGFIWCHMHKNTGIHAHTCAHTYTERGGGGRYKVYLKIGFPRILTSSDGRQTNLRKDGVRTLSHCWNQQLMHEHKLWSSPV